MNTKQQQQILFNEECISVVWQRRVFVLHLITAVKLLKCSFIKSVTCNLFVELL